jgi:ectonucleotide pyrophosphatase/phosphodiesterase family member 5
MHPLDRRTFLKGAAVATGGLIAGAAPTGIWARPAHAGEEHVRVYFVVVDGLRADQVALMPQLQELAEAGTYYPEARAQMVAETGPNHTAMITGMRADRNGHPGNAVPGLPERVGEDPRYLKADSLFSLTRRQAPDLVAATVNAKTYVVNTTRADRTGSGEPDADYHYTPPLTAPDDSARDAVTGPEGIRVSRELDPDLLFWNLGDVDRAGHLDASGGPLGEVAPDGTQPAFQLAALAQADTMIRGMVRELQESGRWDSTVLIVTADHSMDWSLPHRMIDLADAFDADDLLRDEVVTAVNGGACLYGLRSPDEPRAQERLARMREIALATEGVDEALYIRPNPLDGSEEHWVGRVHPDWGLLGDYTGELIVTVQEGWRIGHDGPDSNPIPGNHGHAPTLRIPVIVSGGWDGVVVQRVEPARELAPTDRDPGQAQNIDLAPTIAWLLGLYPPPGGFDGRVLEEAFERRPGTRVGVDNVHSVPLFGRLAGEDRYATSVALSREALPDGLEGADPLLDRLPLNLGNELRDDVLLGSSPSREETAVVVASGEDPTESVAAGPLAARLGAPLLLTRPDELPGIVAEEVARLAPDRAVVVGGEAAVSERVLDQLREAGAGEAERIGGEDGFETARLVALEVGVDDDNRQVVLAPGGDADTYALALAAEPVVAACRRPIPLVGPEELPEATRQALAELEVDRALIAGGEQAVAEEVVEELRSDGVLVERIGADEAGETARLLAERAVREGAPTDDVYLVPAARFAEALAAGPAVQLLRGSLLPVAEQGEAVRRWLRDRADEFVRVRFVGDEQALSADVERDVVRLITERRTRGDDRERDRRPDTPPAHGAPAGAPGRPADPGAGAGDVRGRVAAAGAAPVLPATGGGRLLGGLAAIGAAAALRRRSTGFDAAPAVPSEALEADR